MASVSVIIPVYNVEKYIRQCLDSLCGQTLRDIEIIVVDDGSPDKCGAIIDEYAAKDARFKVIHKKNAGVSAARNDGFKLATGEYVYYVDSDDWLELDALEVMYRKATRAKVDVICPDIFINDRKLTVFNIPETVADTPQGVRPFQRAVFYGNCGFDGHPHSNLGAPWHSMIRRSLIEDAGLTYDPYVRGIFDDGLFMLNVFEHAQSAAYIHDHVYHYRVVESSITHRYRPDCFEAFARAFERLEEFIRRYDKDEKFVNAYYTRVLIYLKRSMSINFFNAQNQKPLKERYAQFKAAVGKEPYRTAIQTVDPKVFKSRLYAICLMLLRAGMPKVAWSVYSVRIGHKLMKG